MLLCVAVCSSFLGEVDRQLHPVPHPIQPGYAHLPPTEDQPLLLWRNTRLLLDLLLDVSDLHTSGGLERVPGYA